MANAAVSCIAVLLVLGGLTLFRATADVFCDNLEQVAATLPNNTASSPAHFATAVFGQAPDVVHALALCRGDIVSDSACGGCVTSTFDRVLNATPLQCYQAASYYGGDCAIVYSDDDILTSSSNAKASNENNTDDEPYPMWNEHSWGDTTGDAQDVSLTIGLLQQLLLETVQAAASASTPPMRFATGIMNSGTAFPMVFYSLAQCTPDLSAGDCWACLNRVLGMFNSTIALRQG